MNKLIASISLLILAVILQNCKGPKHLESNSLDGAKKVILLEEGQEEFFYWELKDESSLWAFELGDVDSLNKYQDSLLLALGHQGYASAIDNESTQSLQKSLIDGEENGDRINALLVHSGSIGKIRKINYLESQILNYQIARFPMFSHPTEFHGFIMRNESEGKIRVYFGSSDAGWPPKPIVIIEEVKKEIKKGWKLIGHLHNHYCNKDKDYVGILAPSLADAQYFKMLKDQFSLDKALITNGFHTVEIENKYFADFESH